MWPSSAAKPAARAGVLVGLAALALAGCETAPRATFDLAPSESAAAPRPAAAPKATLAVNEPEANLPANSDRIVIRTGPQEVAYLADAQWADRLPRLVQSRLVEGFEPTGVSATRPGPAVGFELATELRRFEIDVTSQEAVVEIPARIVREGDGVRSARVFIGRAEAARTAGAQAAQALEEALTAAIRQIVRWASLEIDRESRRITSLESRAELSAPSGAVADAQTDSSRPSPDK